MTEKFSKQEIIDILCEYYSYTEDELLGRSLSQLKELLLQERKESSPDLNPNGRDFDAEDEDCF